MNKIEHGSTNGYADFGLENNVNILRRSCMVCMPILSSIPKEM